MYHDHSVTWMYLDTSPSQTGNQRSLFDFQNNIFQGNRTKIFLKLGDSSFLPGFERIGTSSDRSEIFSKKYSNTKKLSLIFQPGGES